VKTQKQIYLVRIPVVIYYKHKNQNTNWTGRGGDEIRSKQSLGTEKKKTKKKKKYNKNNLKSGWNSHNLEI
jgi:hypothetical protein